MTYAVIPAKHFEGAKQRLSTLLKPHERVQLARAMLTDTLTACCQARGLDGVGVVTHHEAPAEIAASLGAEVWWEPQAGGHSQAVAFGVQTCLQRGIDTMLTLPGDIPLVTPADVEAMARARHAVRADCLGAKPRCAGHQCDALIAPRLPATGVWAR